ncbi:DNA adenine methylase [Empedobacter brevis]|uniref:DNA adenine methylase n=1 Tax=Empedobacter brevis TaxID=247 RepID=UPI0028984715|nr:Dam family site-specific DNA-(adenine-N6)-methyltransferase [Empedobacter brevis]
MTKVKIKPFLRWAGGKRWILKELNNILTIDHYNNYHEPFLGGGSVFFHLNPTNSFLSDANEELINSYIQVRDNVESIIGILNEFKNTEEFYYKIRKEKFDNEIIQAAKFIYLNQTSFNGIYRVNRNGEYNVPYGNRINHKYDFENLRLTSKSLEQSIIIHQDFDISIENIRQGDFVFLDPPYTVAHNKNGFIQYNQKIFSLDDQIRLKNYILAIKEIGAYYIMTNAAHDAVKEIFANGDRMFELQRASLVGGKNAKRDKYSELILTNLP